MKWILIISAQSRHMEGGLCIHSIEFDTVENAHDAGKKWFQENQNRFSTSYIVVAK